MSNKKDYYNVYDLEGNIVFENKTSSEITNELGISQTRISHVAQSGGVALKKYRIENMSQNNQNSETRWSLVEIQKWEEARAPFLKVEWVKKYEPGVKILRGTKS